jgi:glutamine amidotransferase PdxT
MPATLSSPGQKRCDKKVEQLEEVDGLILSVSKSTTMRIN